MLLFPRRVFKKVTEFDYWLSQLVGLVPRDEYRLVIHDCVHRIPNDFRIANSARTGNRAGPGPPALSTWLGEVLSFSFTMFPHVSPAFDGGLLIGPHIDVSTLCDGSLHSSTV
jgi:hypothetical protein